MYNAALKLLNLLPVGYVLTASDDLIISANRFFLNLIQRTDGDVQNKIRLLDLFSDESRLYYESVVRPKLQSESLVQEINIELKRNDGVLQSVLMNAATVRNEENAITTIQFTFFDISLRKIYELELLESNRKQDELVQELQILNAQIRKDSAFYRSMIDNNSFFIVKTDLEGNYTFINQYMCSVLDIEAKDWIGKNSLGLLIEEDHPLCLEIVQRCLAQPNISHWVTLRKQSKTGILSHRWEFRLMTDENGNQTEILCIGHDISDLLKKQNLLETQLLTIKDHNERFRNFTHIVSHNLRSHLTNLKSVIRITDIDNKADVKSAFDMINQTISSMTESFTRLGDITKIQSDTNLPMRPIHLKTEIGKVISGISQIIHESGVHIEVQIDEKEYVISNPAYFESIVLNLLTNSIKYRSLTESPKITFSLRFDGEYKILSVSDNGRGIDLEKYGSKVFGIYQTFHGDKEAKGLGLFMIRTQIEAMKGKISIESELGKGTTLHVYFPVDSIIKPAF